MINNSLNWNKIEMRLKSQSKNLQNNRDLNRMINNIEKKVCQLSRQEIELRRHRSNTVDELLKIINQEIVEIEEFILIASLLG
jgi:hypothetical protein